MSIVLILGGFHLMMSYLGSLGGLMKGAGLKKVLHFICGVNAVEHVLFGKAVSRVLRSHFILESALTTILLKKMIPVSTEQNAPYRNLENNEYQSKIELENEEPDPDDLCEIEESLQSIQKTERYLTETEFV